MKLTRERLLEGDAEFTRRRGSHGAGHFDMWFWGVCLEGLEGRKRRRMS